MRNYIHCVLVYLFLESNLSSILIILRSVAGADLSENLVDLFLQLLDREFLVFLALLHFRDLLLNQSELLLIQVLVIRLQHIL